MGEWINFQNPNIFKKDFYVLCLHECMPQVHLYPLRSTEGIEFLGAGITGSCELPDAGIENGTWVLLEKQ